MYDHKNGACGNNEHRSTNVTDCLKDQCRAEQYAKQMTHESSI